jgi:ATP-dependent Clp protease ATP-binding subunit ClpB
MDQISLTEKAQEALVDAQRLATERHHTQMEPEHLLHALLAQQGGVVPSVLSRLGVDPRTLLERLEPILEGFAKAQGTVQVYVSPRFRRLLDAAEEEARRLKDEYVSTEHVLLALTEDRGPAGQLLQSAGITRDRIYQALQQVRGGQRVTSPTPESSYEALEKYGRDLTQLAESGKLDPVIGRDDEVRRVIQVLSRRTKTTRCSSASQASAKLRSWRGWPRESCGAMFPRD